MGTKLGTRTALATDKNPQVRLRAVDQLLSWQSKQLACPACAARRKRDARHVAILAAASDEDKERARILLREAFVMLGLREPEMPPPPKPGDPGLRAARRET